MPNLNKLKTVLFDRKKTYADCANAVGMSITSFSNKMNGKSSFTVEEANTLSEFLELTNPDRVEIFLP